MRILILNRSRALLGGVETYLQSLVELLSNRGHRISFGYEFDARDGERTITVRDGSYRVVDRDTLRAALHDARPEIVFLHRLESAHLEMTASLATCFVQFLHDYQGACISGTKRHAFPLGKPCLRPLGPACLLHYFPHRCGGLNPVTAAALYRQQRMRQQILRSAAAVIVASTYMQREAIRNGVQGEKLVVAPLFSSQVRDARPPTARPVSNELIFVGRMTKLKGVEVLIDALPFANARLHKNLRLVVAGHGGEVMELRKRALRLGVSVEFRSWVDAAEREELMRRADLLVVPSLWPEPFGIVGIEAASVGLPAVAFDVGGIREWLQPGESGEICATATAPNLGHAIADVMGNAAYLEKLRLGAWKSAGRFTPEAHVTALEAAFAAALRRSPGSL